MTIQEKKEKARKRYNRKVDKARYWPALADAATEYITTLEKLIDTLKAETRIE